MLLQALILPVLALGQQMFDVTIAFDDNTIIDAEDLFLAQTNTVAFPESCPFLPERALDIEFEDSVGHADRSRDCAPHYQSTGRPARPRRRRTE